MKEGVLPSDNKEQIEIAKRKYWNNYKREWKKTRRSENKTFEIMLDEKELKAVQEKAQSLQISITSFIKQSAIVNNGMVTNVQVGEVREILIMQYQYFETLLEEKNILKDIKEEILLQASITEKNILAILKYKQ